MRALSLTLTAAALVACAAGAAIADHADGALFAANEAVMRQAGNPMARNDGDAAPGQDAPLEAYGADPDPAKFDRAGVDSWWARYRQAHQELPTRSAER